MKTQNNISGGATAPWGQAFGFLRVTLATGVVLLGMLAIPVQMNATTYSGLITTPQSAGDDITLSNMTNTAPGTITQTGSSVLDMAGVNSIGGNVTAFSSVRNYNYYGFGTFNTTQTAGTFTMPYWYVNAGNYTLNGGSISNGVWFQMQSGQFTMNGGILNNATYGIIVSGGGIGPNGTTTMTLNGGTVTSAGGLYVGNLSSTTDKGVVVQEAGASVTVNGGPTGALAYDGGTDYFRISKPSATLNGESSYTLKGGTLSISNGNSRIYQWGKFEGYGTLNTTSARTLDNSGKVVANGYGVDRTLDLSRYGTILNSTDNGTERTGAGWYAVNKGKLTLPTLSLSSGTSTRLWGESAGDTTPDLVNSIKLQLNSVATGGNLSISLLAPGRADVPASPDGRAFLGIWDFSTSGGFSFGGGNADLTFRFDDANNQGADLKLWHYDGSWTLLSSTFNDTDHTISTSGVNSFSLFAITVPEPSSAMLLGLGGLLIARRFRTNTQ